MKTLSLVVMGFAWGSWMMVSLSVISFIRKMLASNAELRSLIQQDIDANQKTVEGVTKAIAELKQRPVATATIQSFYKRRWS